MFAFACVFRVVTRPDVPLEARFNQAIALPAPLAPQAAARQASHGTRPAQRSTAAPAAPAAPAATAAPAAPAAPALPVLDALAWPIAEANVTLQIVPLPPSQLKNENGAVTRAFAQTGSALRGAFKKAF